MCTSRGSKILKGVKNKRQGVAEREHPALIIMSGPKAPLRTVELMLLYKTRNGLQIMLKRRIHGVLQAPAQGSWKSLLIIIS
jgi:hypothetical protein